jgi:hypothetical protein
VLLIFVLGQVFEKYHAENVGYPGGGGEYIVQEGFGWTNGVTLWILDKFGDKLTAPKKCYRLETVNIPKEKASNAQNSGPTAPTTAVQMMKYSAQRVGTAIFNILLNIILVVKFF